MKRSPGPPRSPVRHLPTVPAGMYKTVSSSSSFTTVQGQTVWAIRSFRSTERHTTLSRSKPVHLRSYTRVMSVPTNLVTRVVVALVWALAVIGALIEIPLGIIWASGGMGDFKRPEPQLAGLLSIAGLATCILGIALVTTLMWGLGLPLRDQRDEVHSKATAGRLALIATCLIAMGTVFDLARRRDALSDPGLGGHQRAVSHSRPPTGPAPRDEATGPPVGSLGRKNDSYT